MQKLLVSDHHGLRVTERFIAAKVACIAGVGSAGDNHTDAMSAARETGTSARRRSPLFRRVIVAPGP